MNPTHGDSREAAASQCDSATTLNDATAQAVLQAIRDTAFGTVEVVVHQSRIVQITRSEKVRFDNR